MTYRVPDDHRDPQGSSGASALPGTPTASTPTVQRLFGRGSWPEASRITEIMRRETVGGALLLAATAAALAWANSPWSAAYAATRDTVIAPGPLRDLLRAGHLDLTVGTWAADGLLAIFFFVAGLEVKREFVAGDLRDPTRAVLPIAAALGGVVVPAVLYVAVNRSNGAAALQGWAIPVATDIAFALAVLAVVGRWLPSALRTFLLTLAVVDDLIAITIIAVFFTGDLQLLPLLLAVVPLAVFGVCAQCRVRSWWLLVPLALLTWALVHGSGVHATVAGVLLAFTVPVLRRSGASEPNTRPGLAEHFEHRLRPLSAVVAVPVFAFFASGVRIGGIDGLRTALSDPAALGVVVGLVVGKPLGVLAAAWLVARFTRAQLDDGLSWIDITGVALLTGVGFTVSLLIAELAFGAGSPRDDHVKVAVLTASILAAALAGVVLSARNRLHRRICEAETADADHDGIPDVYIGATHAHPPSLPDQG